jgi:hypothetical protein
MKTSIDLRYVILLAFLISVPLILYPTLADPLNLTRAAGGYALLFGLILQLIAVVAGLLDMKRIRASPQSQVLWTLFFITLSMVAFPVYLYKRFNEKDTRRFSRTNCQEDFEGKMQNNCPSSFT